MKNRIVIRIVMAMTIGTGFISSGCEYREFVDADYPDPLIYMPAAVNGIYHIDEVPEPVGAVPTYGAAGRFTVDKAANAFIVPLGVYRSGVSLDDNVLVRIVSSPDTASGLISDGLLQGAELLNPEYYSFPVNVTVKSGSEIARFDLVVDLSFLTDNPNRVYALGISVESENDKVKVNEKIGTAIIAIHTGIFKPTADFSFSRKGNDVTFTNTSTNSVKWVWDFGDGNSDTLRSPKYSYESAGKYRVSLTSIGVLGPENKSVKTAEVTIP